MLKLEPMPGYVIAKPYTIDNKAGVYRLPKDMGDPDKAAEFGEVLEVGPQLPLKKAPYNPDHVPKVGDKIAYKKYNYFTHTIGTKQYVVVHFENILYKIHQDVEVKPD